MGSTSLLQASSFKLKSQTIALREIRHCQKSTELLIRKPPFQQFEIMEDFEVCFFPCSDLPINSLYYSEPIFAAIASGNLLKATSFPFSKMPTWLPSSPHVSPSIPRVSHSHQVAAIQDHTKHVTIQPKGRVRVKASWPTHPPALKTPPRPPSTRSISPSMLTLSPGCACDVCAEEYGPHRLPHSISCGMFFFPLKIFVKRKNLNAFVQAMSSVPAAAQP